MSKICVLSGKKKNNGYQVSHSHIRTKKKQEVNLQYKKIWSVKKNSWIRLKISTKIIKSLHKIKI
uniref:Large ribosomal subunit protein bL28c n=1 Tax=Laurencia verruciformis TaxID=3073068 RepID=A0AA51NFB0_9FLOR|nr:50S ribosomal protein L28 [Laurencia obtusa]WMP12237.1 50S ribosomal protein L28 [Laurencia verruciformis]WMP12881.1 50S ribosomal protein L28 [Laurencia obtusa]